MSVTGIKPDAPSGEYFGANVVRWTLVRSLTHSLCQELLDDDTWYLMTGNNGAGADDRETCLAMADRIDEWRNCDEAVNHAIATMAEIGMVADQEAVMAVTEEWIQFLRHCGGFAVW